MTELLRLEPELDSPDDPEALFCRVLRVYGAQRLTLRARGALNHAWTWLRAPVPEPPGAELQSILGER